jgi:drug/metabolite transporter (DMT)-like permease
MRIDNAPRGIALMVLGAGCIVVNDAAMKWVVMEHPIGQAIFVRGLFALIPIWLLVRRSGGYQSLRWTRASSHLLCAVLLVVPLFIFIYSLSQLSLALATLIFFANPLFITLLAPLILGEEIGWRRRAAVVVGFIGVAIIMDPSGGEFRWVMLGPVFVALFSAFRDLVIRRLVVNETSVALLASSSLLVTLTALSTFPLGWDVLELTDVAALALAGAGFGFGIYFMTDALRYADASLLSLYKYSAVIWSLFLGFAIWRDIPGSRTCFGAALILASGLYIAYRERRKRS